MVPLYKSLYSRFLQESPTKRVLGIVGSSHDRKVSSLICHYRIVDEEIEACVWQYDVHAWTSLRGISEYECEDWVLVQQT